MVSGGSWGVVSEADLGRLKGMSEEGIRTVLGIIDSACCSCRGGLSVGGELSGRAFGIVGVGLGLATTTFRLLAVEEAT